MATGSAISGTFKRLTSRKDPCIHVKNAEKRKSLSMLRGNVQIICSFLLFSSPEKFISNGGDVVRDNTSDIHNTRKS